MEWESETIKRHFEEIGYRYNNVTLENAVACVIEARCCFPDIDIKAIVEGLYPKDDIVPSPS